MPINIFVYLLILEKNFHETKIKQRRVPLRHTRAKGESSSSSYSLLTSALDGVSGKR
jgi:hypothetical protein